MATPTKWGPEFLVNTTTESSQDFPAISQLSDGRFVAAWANFNNNSLETDVRAQIFNADGSKAGAEFLVNTNTTNEQSVPALTALTGGRFVAMWQDKSNGVDYDIRAQIFNADGSKSGLGFLVNSNTVANQQSPEVITLAGGRFVAAWDDGGAQFGKGLEFGQRSAVLDRNAGDKNFVVMMAMKFGDGLGHGIIGAPALNDEDAAGNGVVDGKEGMDAPHDHHGHKDEGQDESQPAAQGGDQA